MKIDYAFKADILTNHKAELKHAKTIQQVLHLKKDFVNKSTGEVIQSLYDAYYYDIEHQSDNIYKECVKINNASYNRIERLRKRISKFVNTSYCQFLTITFTNDVLSSTSAQTRRKYVTRWLKDNCSEYVANIDYGAKNGREHYHAVVISNYIDYTSWNYGALNAQKVINKTDKDLDKSIQCLPKYISKLTNHAIKNTTKRNAIIYSRPKKNETTNDKNFYLQRDKEV